MEHFTHEALAIEIDLIARLNVWSGDSGKDSGKQRISTEDADGQWSGSAAQWAEEHGVMLEFIKPGKPTQSTFIERFNRAHHTEILHFYLHRMLNLACMLDGHFSSAVRWLTTPEKKLMLMPLF